MPFSTVCIFKSFCWLNWSNISESIISGIILALIFFFFREKVCKNPNINGMWTFISTTQKTRHKEFEGMKLIFIVLLWREGNTISGNGEKVAEVINGIKHEYPTQKRIQLKISGNVNKNFIKSDQSLYLTLSQSVTLAIDPLIKNMLDIWAPIVKEIGDGSSNLEIAKVNKVILEKIKAGKWIRSCNKASFFNKDEYKNIEKFDVILCLVNDWRDSPKEIILMKF